MPDSLTEDDWYALLQGISDESCTPFLGAGVCHPTLPLGGEIAREWARAEGYPLDDPHDLARVAQFLAVKHRNPMLPKLRLLERLNIDGVGPATDAPCEPHTILAALPFPIYLTTNYDDFMFRALERQPGKAPQRDFCRWNDLPRVKAAPRVLGRETTYDPSKEEPLVYHLHGYHKVRESLVLTEEDYLIYMVNVWGDQQDHDRLPPRIHEAFVMSLLFIGYSLADWDFRMLFQWAVMSTASGLRNISVTVQLPEPDDAKREFLVQSCDQKLIRVYWGTAEQFAADLRERWEAFSGEH